MGVALLRLLLALSVNTAPPAYRSPFLRVELAPDQPAFTALALDSLGKNHPGPNALRPPPAPPKPYTFRRAGSQYEYRSAGWSFEFSPRQIHLTSTYSPEHPPAPLVFDFDTEINHATLLGLFDAEGRIKLPALLHLPDQGTIRITSKPGSRISLGYDAWRSRGGTDIAAKRDDHAKVTLPAATADLPAIDYTFDVVAIYPSVPGVEQDARFDGFRRNWMNNFQITARERLLTCTAGSTACACSLFLYSCIAERTPPLAPGLTALDLIRQDLDRYLGGFKVYGIAGGHKHTPYDFLDTYPSLLTAAWDYVHGSHDEPWLTTNYTGLKAWADRMLAMDKDGNGLLEYPASGNTGSWTPRLTVRPANWWDAAGFGHEDAYSNAVAYHALEGMADLARVNARPQDADYYAGRAEKLRSAYYPAFYNPKTGVLAGWRSADGELHDYYFVFVNTVAITYNLVPEREANRIMDRLLAKMNEAGYTDFGHGVPSNLIPIRRGDYVDHGQLWGGAAKEDGSDSFQFYHNGGATPNFAYYTLAALYKLGRHEQADAILFPMLAAYDRGSFQGRGANGMTYDWQTWKGTPRGYEGLMADGYQALLAVLSR